MNNQLILFGKRFVHIQFRQIFKFSTINFDTKPKICYYKTLNVSTSASIDEIKKQYISLAKKYHPDANPDKPESDKFKDIQQAYQVLSDKSRRKLYDEANGMISSWEYDNVGSTFGQNEEIYNEYLKKRKEQDKVADNIDEQVASYFQNKYFKNPEQNKKFIVDDDPFEMTVKLYKTHQQEIQSKKSEYVQFFPYTYKAYYEKLSDEEKLKKKGIVLTTLLDFKYLIIGCVLFITGNSIYQAISQKNAEKQQLLQAEQLTKGSGYKAKLLPLNVV